MREFAIRFSNTDMGLSVGFRPSCNTASLPLESRAAFPSELWRVRTLGTIAGGAPITLDTLGGEASLPLPLLLDTPIKPRVPESIVQVNLQRYSY